VGNRQLTDRCQHLGRADRLLHERWLQYRAALLVTAMLVALYTVWW